jgi:hypothetical protein
MDRRLRKILNLNGVEEARAWRLTQVHLLMTFGAGESDSEDFRTPPELLATDRGKNLIQVHDYDGRTWFREEAFRDFFRWVFLWCDLAIANSPEGFSNPKASLSKGMGFAQ